jgi:hypothetical protein
MQRTNIIYFKIRMQRTNIIYFNARMQNYYNYRDVVRNPGQKHYVYCVGIYDLYTYNIIDSLPFADQKGWYKTINNSHLIHQQKLILSLFDLF